MKKVLMMTLLGVVSTAVMAVPAKRGALVHTQSDGTQVTFYLHGDENFHYLSNEAGEWLEEDEQGNLKVIPALSEAQIAERCATGKFAAQQRRRVAAMKAETGVDRLLSPRGAVILVSYADKDFSSTNEEMTEWAMGDNYTHNGATGSIHQYFWDQSWGQYDLQIDVYGPVKVSKDLAYYGKNNSYGEDAHADELVVEACKLAHDNYGADFSKYDFDGDGKVDWVVIIYAGYGEASGAPANTIWPHQYELSYTGKSFMLDGKTVDHYCCLNELTGKSGNHRDGIGTFCHEFSHVMGLPDFYETNAYGTGAWLGLHTLVDWDIMDYGPYNNDGNTPPNYSAYERWFMGWMTPTLINTAASVTLPALHDSHAAALLTTTGENVSDVLNPTPKTFFLLENRKKEGWDKYLPGKGMLITKIRYNRSYWLNNEVNNRTNYMGVDIMEARTNSGDWGRSSDAYPAGNTQYYGIDNYEITNIALTDGVISFDVNDGGESIILGVEKVQSDQVQSTKMLREGQVVIMRNGKIYDLNGRQL